MNFIDKSELPRELFRLGNPPNGLFYIGNKELLHLPKIAIVGSRKASVYTKNCVNELSKRLKNADVCVVSGGAIGVDIAAHTAALPYTIGVFANGLDIIYPKSNEKIISEIYKNGLVISEYEPNSTPLRHRFLERNRIVVSLCKALVVAQADLQSGSLQSARIANEIGVPLFVLPQRIGESNGTNLLLANKKASLIADFDEFVAMFVQKTKPQNSQDDKILQFCKNGVSLDKALAKFGNKIYEYELEGKIEISNLTARSI
ncbi:DNA processing protein DprA [Campylobacter mucosalis]|uniref:DNA-processing protein DprA n=1 Tax=Campylobacter mucosalis TaxID=202 RepID=UPI0004D62151|nr:DNA-processing protein DprA [Campylobacter mucosalis]KEA46338.1 DNA processing protein DprA [Campylobacter mucosalis]QKF63184.1 DNA protecting protein DprA [Campylobacter mucosalis]